jgi:hypothetical protein
LRKKYSFLHGIFTFTSPFCGTCHGSHLPSGCATPWCRRHRTVVVPITPHGVHRSTRVWIAPHDNVTRSVARKRRNPRVRETTCWDYGYPLVSCRWPTMYKLRNCTSGEQQIPGTRFSKNSTMCGLWDLEVCVCTRACTHAVRTRTYRTHGTPRGRRPPCDATAARPCHARAPKVHVCAHDARDDAHGGRREVAVTRYQQRGPRARV